MSEQEIIQTVQELLEQIRLLKEKISSNEDEIQSLNRQLFLARPCEDL